MSETGSITPVGINHIVLNVRDIEESHRFWTEIVGLKQVSELRKRPEMPNMPTMRFYSGDHGGKFTHHDIALVENPNLPAPKEWALFGVPVAINHVAIAMPDRDSFVRKLAELQAKGVKFNMRVNHGVTHSVYINDPNGYGVELLYELPREMWEGDIDAGINYFQPLPTEGEEFLALGRQGLEVVDPGIDVALPHLARQFVKQLDAVAVRVVDVDAVGHAVIDPHVELDPLGLQLRQFSDKGVAVRHRDRDMVDRHQGAEQRPFLRRRQVRVLDQRHVVMRELAAMIAAVEAHLRHVRHFGPLVQFAHLLKTDNLGPEPVQFLDVAHIEDDVIDPDRGDAAGLRHSLSARFAASARRSIGFDQIRGNAPHAEKQGDRIWHPAVAAALIVMAA